MTTRETLSIIAHYETAVEIAQSVPGLERYAEVWLNKVPLRDRRVLDRYLEARQNAFEAAASLTGQFLVRDHDGQIKSLTALVMAASASAPEVALDPSAIDDRLSAIPQEADCPDCQGRGHDQGSISRKCETCNGTRKASQ